MDDLGWCEHLLKQGSTSRCNENHGRSRYIHLRVVLYLNLQRLTFRPGTQTNTDRIKPYKTKISTQTRPMDIMQHIASKGASLHCPTRAPRPENMPRGPSAPHAPSMPGAQCGRDRARPLRADPPDPHILGKRVPRCPRRYAACSWTPRCARAMACDRGCSRSASQRRYRRATCEPQGGRLERAARDLRCRVCCGDGAGSMGRAARPCACRTRYLTFTHTDSPVSRR